MTHLTILEGKSKKIVCTTKASANDRTTWDPRKITCSACELWYMENKKHYKESQKFK